MVYLEQHIKKYPLMQIEDKIKLIFQSIMGPGHFISDKDLVLERLLNEYQEIKDLNCSDELVEEISDDFARIYIKPYFMKHKSFEKLVEAFTLSCNEYADMYFLEKELLKLREKQTDQDKKKIDEYFLSGDLLISHSKIYKENYHPHYLVISKKYLSMIE